MKTAIFFFFTALCLSLSAQIDINATNEIARNDAFRASKMMKAPVFVGHEYDLKYHRFNWTVDPALNAISGTVTSYFVAVQNNLTQLDFSLEVGMWVDSVKYHGAPAMSVHVTDVVSITGFPAIIAGTLDSITIFYHGTPSLATGSFGSFVTGVHGTSNTPVLWTLSEPYGTYEWWPCKNDLSDKIDSIDVYVTHPNGYHAASNGLLVSETVGAATTAHWRHRYPIAAYLIAIAVTDYSIYTDNFSLSQGSLPVLNYVFPEDLLNAQGSTPTLAPVMQFYDSIIAPYPYMSEKYGHAQFGWGGGMEHQTMSFMVGFGYELMAHELLHQWFGDAVTCGSWHDIWLNEGFATYFTALNYERFFPTDLYWMPWKQMAINTVISAPDGSVYVYDTTDVGRVFSSRLSYYKGAYVLHMLRWVTGDSAFFQGIRNYFNDPSNKYDYAKSPDLIAHLETSSGLDLTEFFADWLYGEGYPSYQTQISYLSDDTVSVVINQTQSHSSVSFFEMPVPITFWNNGIDTTVVFNSTFSGQEFRFVYHAYPDSVRFDPTLWLLSANNSMILSVGEQIVPEISIFPNPASNQITISCGSAELKLALTVYDSRGAVVLKSSFLSGQATNISALAAGLYQVVVEGSGWNYSGSFVKK